MTGFNPKKGQAMPFVINRFCRFSVLFLLLFVVCPGYGTAATLNVTNTNDSGAGSLRQAIADAASGDTINFSLTYPATITVSTKLSIYEEITINGPGAGSLEVRMTGEDSVFLINQSSSANNTVTIKGLKISGGNAPRGGGINLVSAGLHLENCRISGNRAAGGGGVAVSTGGSLTVIDTEIVLNQADKSTTGSGGGINVMDGCSLNMERVTISDNEASYNGGGIHLSCSGTVSISDSTIADNTANKYGGGIYFRRVEGDGTLIMADCEISGNSAIDNDGGGLWIDGPGLEMTGCLISENHGKGYGGGIMSAPEPPAEATLQNCTFIENTTTKYGGGGVRLKGTSLAVFDDCLFQGNQAVNGGGISAAGQITVTIKNSTFIANTAVEAPTGPGNGGGVILTCVGSAISGCLFEGNYADGLGGGIYIFQSGPHTITNTTIHGNLASGSGGGGLAVRGKSTIYDPPTRTELSFVTISGNTGDYDCTTSGGAGCESAPGGGIFLEEGPAGVPIVTMKSCVVAENNDTRDPQKVQWNGDLSAGDFTSAGYNFIGRKKTNTNGFTNGVNNDQVGGLQPLYPKLMDLADYGGYTHSRMPMPDSPLVNAGGPATDASGNPVTTDQRGKLRPMGSACDTGAVERDGGSLLPIYLLLLK